MRSSFLQWSRRLAGLAALVVVPGARAAAQVSFFGTGGDVWVKYQGCDAGYTSDLYAGYTIAGSGSTQYLFTCHVTPLGTQYNLGSVDAGTEVIFSLYVRNTGFMFYSGPGSRNPDGQVHVASWGVTGDGVYTREFGFEDLYGGGDRDYNDNTFRIGGVIDSSVTPEPASVVLLATGLLAVIGVGYRRRIA
jgi:hypothetical protein